MNSFKASRLPATFGCLWMVGKVVLAVIAYQVFDHFADHLEASLVLDRGWNAYIVIRNRGGIDLLLTIALVWWVIRNKDDETPQAGNRGGAFQCKPMKPDENGWSEWVHPLPGYLMQCCDCGLIHEMEFAIGERDGPKGPLNEGEAEGALILFRARRAASDSGSDPQGENAGTAVEGEASQSGAPESAHRPETSTPSSTGAGQ